MLFDSALGIKTTNIVAKLCSIKIHSMLTLQKFYAITGITVLFGCLTFDFDFSVVRIMTEMYLHVTDTTVSLLLPPHWQTITAGKATLL